MGVFVFSSDYHHFADIKSHPKQKKSSGSSQDDCKMAKKRQMCTGTHQETITITEKSEADLFFVVGHHYQFNESTVRTVGIH